jgi:hypothetical protein
MGLITGIQQGSLKIKEMISITYHINSIKGKPTWSSQPM